MKEYNWEKLHVPMDSEAPRPQGGACGALAGQLGESPFVIFQKEG
jgi:hypothetical protein